ncbi:MAG: hypothetical protein FWH04_08615 [Oscillospiraceae bacterium]|nr:hypothetical protein [Oscillospiraceae bacterium]
MFRVDINGDNVNLYVNDRLILRHTPDAPFVEAGKGRWEISGRAVYDRKSRLTPLVQAQYEPVRGLLRFFGGNYSISWHISERDGHVRLAPQRASTGLNRFRLRFSIIPGLAVYGGGAQFQRINLRGSKVPIWVEEQRVFRKSFRPPAMHMKGVAKNISGCPLPVLLTENNGYYIFDCAGRMLFDLTHAKHFNVDFWELPGAITLGNSQSPLECVSKITKLTGRQPVLPQWVFDGACIEGVGGSRKLAESLEKALMSGAKISSVYIPDWTGGLETPGGRRPFFDWIWNADLYPKLDKLIQQLAQKGIRTIAYVNPHLSIEGRLFAEASAGGFLVQKPQGGNYISDMGGFMVGHLDLTNPEACAWYRGIIRRNILGIGFCGYYADRGEYLPPDAVVRSGENAVRLHNRWPGLWGELNRETIKEAGRTADAIFFTRFGSGGIGKQTMLLSTGEHHSAWNMKQGLPSALTAALSLSCSGMGLNVTDCGGSVSFWAGRSKELYLRWMEYAAFSPVLRLCDGDISGWRLHDDDETPAFFARMSKIHAALSGYIRECARENTFEGWPVMRPLFMNFPTEPLFSGVRDAYALGSELLVYPVLRKGQKKVKLYLPQGVWTHLWSGEEYQNGSHIIDAPLGVPAVFYRPSSKNAALFEYIRTI